LPARKPRFALFVATACGLGYIPFAPGTFGSLAGLLLALVPWWSFFIVQNVYIAARPSDAGPFISKFTRFGDPLLLAHLIIFILIAAVGVWTADRAARFWGEKDPQRVVIDEVSGQHLTFLLGCGVPVWWRVMKFPWPDYPFGLISFGVDAVLSWKYLLLGLILFRAFDIWKPFPARQAESLPGGWGIMADDWVAGVYAAIGLWIARAVFHL